MKSYRQEFQIILVIVVIMAFVTPSRADDNELVRQMELNRIKREIKELPPHAKVETKCPDKCGKIAADLEAVQERKKQIAETLDKIVNNIRETEVEWNRLKDIKESKGLSSEEQTKLVDVDYKLKSLYKQIPVLEKELLDLDSKAAELKDQLAACERQCQCERGKAFADEASCQRACPQGKYCFLQIALVEGGTACWVCVPEGYRSSQLIACPKYGPANQNEDFATCMTHCPKATHYCSGEYLTKLVGDKLSEEQKKSLKAVRCYKCVPKAITTGGTTGGRTVKAEEGGTSTTEIPKTPQVQATTPTTLASSRLTNPTLGGEIRVRSEFNQFTQYHSNGLKSNSDEGWTRGVDGEVEANLWDRRVRLSINANVMTAPDGDHTQYSSSGTSETSNTKLFTLGADFLAQYNFTLGEFNIAPQVGLDYWDFHRRVSFPDFEERWQSADSFEGFLVQYIEYLREGANIFSVRGGLLTPFNNTVRVDSPELMGHVRFHPGKRLGFYTEAGMQLGRFTVSVDYTQRKFAQSMPVVIPVLRGVFTENRTKNNSVAVAVGYKF